MFSNEITTLYEMGWISLCQHGNNFLGEFHWTIFINNASFFCFYLQIFVSYQQKRRSHIFGVIMHHFSPIYVAIIFVGALLVQSEAKREYAISAGTLELGPIECKHFSMERLQPRIYWFVVTYYISSILVSARLCVWQCKTCDASSLH